MEQRLNRFAREDRSVCTFVQNFWQKLCTKTIKGSPKHIQTVDGLKALTGAKEDQCPIPQKGQGARIDTKITLKCVWFHKINVVLFSFMTKALCGLVSAVCSLGGVCRCWAAAGAADIHTISIGSIQPLRRCANLNPSIETLAGLPRLPEFYTFDLWILKII